MLDYRKSALVPMIGTRSGRVEFVIQVYGRLASELLIVPNEVIYSLANKYPDHTSSPFLIENGVSHKHMNKSFRVA